MYIHTHIYIYDNNIFLLLMQKESMVFVTVARSNDSYSLRVKLSILECSPVCKEQEQGTGSIGIAACSFIYLSFIFIF